MNLTHLVDTTRQLPANVFAEEWCRFFFFDSDWMFHTDFFREVKAVLRAEGASRARMWKLDSVAHGRTSRDQSFDICESASAADYAAVLKGSHANPGWTYGQDRFACASESEMWCLYCEQRNELGVIAMRASISQAACSRLIAATKALPIFHAIEQAHIYGLSETAMSDEWRAKLVANY